MNFYYFLLIIIIIIVNLLNVINTEDRKQSTLDVLYLVPDYLDSVYTLNEKPMFGNGITNGWLLPAEEPISLNLYLYYDGTDERRLNTFFHSSNKLSNDSSTLTTNSNNKYVNNTIITTTTTTSSSSNKQKQSSKALLYVYFTESKTNCKESKNHQPLDIVEKLASNMYKANLIDIVLPYSSNPYYLCMQQFDDDEDINDALRYFSHQGEDYWITIITTKSFLPLWARIVLFGILLSLSGLFSGLNLGLMSLDLNELEILKKIGTPKEQSFASKIYPLRKRGNFLLCTILLGNVLVNSTSTLILGDILSGVYAALGSTLLIVIFGEIIPQAACSKHGLAVGAYTRHITYFFMIITCPLSFPISLILDKVLGKEIAAVYNREKIRELMKNVKDMNKKELKMISGALDFNNKIVKEIMTPLDEVFMLERSERLDFETIAKISQQGFSRIPVYDKNKKDVSGLLHVKDFTLLDPDDNMPVEAILKFYNHSIVTCYHDKPIDQMFEEFSKGETHLAFVVEVVSSPDTDPAEEIIGIVTLEDIIEALVQMEIYDEFDDKKEIEKDDDNDDDMCSSPEETYRPVTNSSSENTKQGAIKLERRATSTINNRNNNNQSPNSNKQLLKAINDESTVALVGGSSASINRVPTGSRKNKVNKDASKVKPVNLAPPHIETQNSHDLTFFIQQQKEGGQRALISPQIRFVMFQFLFTTVKPFTSEFLTKHVLELIFKKVAFKESCRRETNKSTNSPEYLYKYGQGCNHFILILSGEATIEVGREKLEFPAGPFAYFGTNALLCGAEKAEDILNEDVLSMSCSTPISSPPNAVAAVVATPDKSSTNSTSFSTSKQYIPDFSLRVDEKCVYLKLDRELWRTGVIKSQYEIKNNELSDNIDYFPSNEESNYDIAANNIISSSIINNNNSSNFNKNNIVNHSLPFKDKQRRSTISTGAVVASRITNSPFPLTPTSQKGKHYQNYLPLTLLENSNINNHNHNKTNLRSDSSSINDSEKQATNTVNQSISIELNDLDKINSLNSNTSLDN